MEISNLLIESIENLEKYEDYKFRQYFAHLFIALGFLYSVFYILAFYYYPYVYDIIGQNLPVFRLSILFVVMFYFFYGLIILKKLMFQKDWK